MDHLEPEQLAPAAGTIPAEDLAQLVALRREADRLKAELGKVNTEAAGLSERLLEQFLENGVRQVKASDGSTVYIARKAYYAVVALDGESKPEAEARIAAALEEFGLGHLVTHPTVLDLGGVKAEIEEQAAEPLAPETEPESIRFLRSLFKASEVFDLRVRRR
jgi:hypothetical protein